MHIEGSESRSERKGFAERKKGENEVDLAGVESREEEEAGVQNFGGFSFPPYLSRSPRNARLLKL